MASRFTNCSPWRNEICEFLFFLWEPYRNARLSEKQTPWPSIWTTSALMFFNGVQKSVYLTSSWPYISNLNPQGAIDLFGWAYSVGPLGAAFAAALLGYWTQKSNSTKIPVTMGFFLCAIGNLLYGLLPSLPDSMLTWTLIGSRFLIGAGTGNHSSNVEKEYIFREILWIWEALWGLQVRAKIEWKRSL